MRLSDAQLQQIGAALKEMESTGRESLYPIAAVRLLFFTGRRLREILDLKWSQVDLEGRNLVIEKHKTDGRVGALKTPLNDAALDVLHGLPRLDSNPYVLPGVLPGRPIQDLRKFWSRLIKAAKLDQIQKESGEATTLRRHDLRHAHGNAAADLDMTLQTTAALLGHKDAHTSSRYSKTGENRTLLASQRVSESLRIKIGGIK